MTTTTTTTTTENGKQNTIKHPNQANAERYAAAVLGWESANGVICHVLITNTITGETTEMEF